MAWSAHVVVACIVERDGKFLMVEEQITAQGPTLFNQPAGHWEADETLVEAAVRETLEETGWDVRPTAVLGIYEFKPPELEYTFLRVAFVAEALRHHPERALDDGIVAAHWMTADEIQALQARHRGPAVLRCIADYGKSQRYPLDLIAHLRP